MKVHFQRAFWPITATAAFFGLALIEYPLGKPRRLLSLIYATVAFSMQLAMYMISITWPDTTNTIFIKSVLNVLLFCCNFIILASICLTHWHGKRYYKCMERFNKVDETLRALGIETDYSKLRRIGLFALSMWVIMCILLNGYNSATHGIEFADNRIAFLVFFMYMPLHIRMLIQMQLSSVLRNAGARFDSISSALRRLITDDNDCTNWFRNSEMISVRGAFVPNERARRIIWTIMHLHFQLCEILRDINTAFETQMCLQMGFDCVFLLCNIIFAFRVIPFEGNKLVAALTICFWTLPYLAEIIITNHLCETVGAKARTVCEMAVQLLRFMDDEKMREDISFIVLQTKLRPLRFSCLGLYNFGYHYIHEIFYSVVRNAVIILQLQTGLQPY